MWAHVGTGHVAETCYQCKICMGCFSVKERTQKMSLIVFDYILN